MDSFIVELGSISEQTKGGTGLPPDQNMGAEPDQQIVV